MSFSLKVKEELAAATGNARHCQIAELAAIICMCGQVLHKKNGFIIKISTENIFVARKYQMLVKKTFGIEAETNVRYNTHTRKNRIYNLYICDTSVSLKVLQAVRLLNKQNEPDENMTLTDTIGITNMCCKRSYLRGAFLCSGSISDPEKFYHLEIVCSDEKKACQIRDTILSFDLDARIVKRRKYYVVYLKEGSQIVDMLNIMGAYVSLMNLENVRIVKEVRNTVNRQVNCETANLGKTISAAVKQTEDITYIKETIGLDSLSEGLSEIAMLRLEHPDMPLKELGQLLTPTVGKSGVNHRLRKIGIIADELRQDREEVL